jgi:hypothetical protein
MYVCMYIYIYIYIYICIYIDTLYVCNNNPQSITKPYGREIILNFSCWMAHPLQHFSKRLLSDSKTIVVLINQKESWFCESLGVNLSQCCHLAVKSTNCLNSIALPNRSSLFKVGDLFVTFLSIWCFVLKVICDTYQLLLIKGRPFALAVLNSRSVTTFLRKSRSDWCSCQRFVTSGYFATSWEQCSFRNASLCTDWREKWPKSKESPVFV